MAGVSLRHWKDADRGVAVLRSGCGGADAHRVPVLHARDWLGGLVKRRFVRVFYEPRGHRACGGVFVELDCEHVVVVDPGQRLRKAYNCWHCAEAARIDQLLRDYLPPL